MKYRISLIIIGLVAGMTSLAAAAGQDPGQQGRNPAPAYQPLDANLTLPAGTLITVRTSEMLSSDRNRPHDAFTTILEQPLVAQGWVVARRGQVVTGQVVTAEQAGRAKGVSELSIELVEVVLVDGTQIPIRTQLIQSSAGTSRGRDAQGIGVATGIGAVIGAAAGGGEGAAIGAAAGAAAGVAGVLTTRGRATEIPPETVLSFRLIDPVTIDTRQSTQAFHPVTAEDYPDIQGPRDREQPYAARRYVPPPSPYYPSPYYYEPYPYYYPSYGFGLYIGPRYYGPRYYGPRYYGGASIFIGPRIYRRR